MKKISELSEECIERWGDEDENTKNFSNKVGKFISQLGDDKETGEILLDLLQVYNYYSRKRMNQILKGIYKMIIQLGLPKQRTIYSRIEKGHKINSSSNLLEEFKIINSIGNNYSHDITKMKENELKEVDYIVFIDDIIGSGQTIVKFLKANEEKIKDKIIFIFCIESMEEGKSNIEQYFKSIKCNSYVIPYKVTQKAFSPNGIFKEDSEHKKTKLTNFEKKRIKSGNYILGFKDSEALVSFYRNTPNNTISSYWYPQNGWNPLFPRDLSKPDCMKQPSKKNNIAYNLAKTIKEKGIDMSCITI